MLRQTQQAIKCNNLNPYYIIHAVFKPVGVSSQKMQSPPFEVGRRLLDPFPSIPCSYLTFL
jgi:hypothetical protein